MEVNFRLTPARKALIEIFKQNKQPLSAIKIQDDLSKVNIVVNKTTIYRELDFFLKHKLIDEVIINSNKKYYESSNLQHHHHFVCNDCGNISDVVLTQDIETEKTRIESESGFKITKHLIEFFGLCNNCK